MEAKNKDSNNCHGLKNWLKTAVRVGSMRANASNHLLSNTAGI